MNKRQENLLSAIIEEYTQSATPIGSQLLVKSRNFSVSPATIRNEMSELEGLGYITHPHTSAGRIPTERGYQFYIDNFFKEQEITRKEKERLQKAVKSDTRKEIKSLAKEISDLTGQAVVVGFSKNNYYYTGISNLFSQPEFTDYGFTCTMSEVIDRFDDVISELIDSIDDNICIYIGKKNPFGDSCSSIMTRFKHKNFSAGIFGITGPMRMDYKKNYCVIKYARNLMNEL